MRNKNQKKQGEEKAGFNPVAAAVTGAIVGAGVAVAGIVALKDKKNRKNVRRVLDNVKDQAVEYIEDMQKQAQDKMVEVEKNLRKAKKSN